MTTRRVELPPYAFRVREAGKGTPVILLHGLSGSARWWDRNFEALAQRHAVAAVELTGFGSNRRLLGSPLPLPFDESVSLLARWLAAAYEAPVHLVGHSMGGQLAIELAARAPDRVASLTLVASSGVPFELRPEPHVRALLRQPAAVMSFGPRLAVDALRAGPGSIALASMHLLLRDSRGAMERIAAPVMLIWGDSDPLIPLEYADAIRERIPHAELEVLERAGHVPMWDQPEAFNARLLRFLGDVERGAYGPPGQPAAGRVPEFAWAIEGVGEGICWRASAGRPRVVLVHGLGIGSRYFRRLAAALHAEGIEAAAPDLPGIGFSDELERGDHDAVARKLLAWAEATGLGEALWIGHSTGCQIVEAVRRAAPDPPRAVWVAPVWTRRRAAVVRLPLLLALGAFREPWGLVAEAVRAYWDAGAARVVRKAFAARRDLAEAVVAPERTLAVFGSRDRLVDRGRLAELGVACRENEGGHGVIWSHPEEVARVVREFLGS